MASRIFQKKGIVGVCNPLIDITMEVAEKAFLDRYAIKAGNAILAEQAIHKELLETVWQRRKEDSKVVVAPGGSGLNTIRAANVGISFQISYSSCSNRDTRGLASLLAAWEVMSRLTH